MILRRTSTVLCVTLIQLSMLSACGGRAANPVRSVQAGDSVLGCDALRAEMSNVEAQAAALVPESKKTGKNVALATAGVFLIVPFFFMDSGAAEDAEIRAYRDRYAELQKTYAQKGCERQAASGPTPIGAKSKKDRLIELKELFDQGLISESEYEKAKASLLTMD